MARHIKAGSNNPSDVDSRVIVYNLIAAGGPFRENPEIFEIGRALKPQGVGYPAEELFIGRVEGHSMEPLIRSGSYILVRKIVPGSRYGRFLLIEDRHLGGDGYTLKRYMRPADQGPERSSHPPIN